MTREAELQSHWERRHVEEFLWPKEVISLHRHVYDCLPQVEADRFTKDTFAGLSPRVNFSSFGTEWKFWLLTDERIGLRRVVEPDGLAAINRAVELLEMRLGGSEPRGMDWLNLMGAAGRAADRVVAAAEHKWEMAARQAGMFPSGVVSFRSSMTMSPSMGAKVATLRTAEKAATRSERYAVSASAQAMRVVDHAARSDADWRSAAMASFEVARTVAEAASAVSAEEGELAESKVHFLFRDQFLAILAREHRALV